MPHQKSYAQIMAHGMLVLPVQIVSLNGVSPMETSSPHYQQSNGFSESCFKIAKHTLQCAKYNITNPRIALQHLRATPVDAKHPSPSQMLYIYKIHTTIPSRICNTDQAALQVQEHLEDQVKHAKSYAVKCSKQLAPFCAGQPIAIFDTLRKISIPATVVHVLPKNSYHVCTANGTICHHTRCHLWECSVKCNDAEPKTPSATSEQAHTRFPKPLPTACHSTSINTTISYTCDSRTKPYCQCLHTYSHAKGHPSANTHLYTKCSTCATMMVRPCPHSTKIPAHRDVTEEVIVPDSMNDVLNPECPWTILAICALRCWTLSLPQHLNKHHNQLHL